MTRLERERMAIKLKPKNMMNFVKFMIAHASPLEAFEYVEEWKKEMQSWKPQYPDLIALSPRTKIRNRDFLDGFHDGFEQAKIMMLGELKKR